MKKQYLYRFLEFFIVGVILGLTEDILAIKFATDAIIDANVVLIALLVALPFAIFSELIVDWRHFKIIRKLRAQLKNKKNKL